VGDQWGVVVGEQRAVVHDEVEQVRHLLQVGRDIWIVPAEVHVIELDVDDVFDGTGGARWSQELTGRRRGRRNWCG
jgi:hypothetical protein